MKRNLLRFKRLVCVLAVICALLSCGLTAFAAEEGSTDKPPTDPPQITSIESTAEPSVIVPLPPLQETKNELYPADVQTIADENGQRIVKTYILTAGDNPADIPRDNFERDGWRYTLTDITQKKINGTDTRPHTQTVEINTDSNNLNDILAQLSPTMEYESEDGLPDNLHKFIISCTNAYAPRF